MLRRPRRLTSAPTTLRDALAGLDGRTDEHLTTLTCEGTQTDSNSDGLEDFDSPSTPDFINSALQAGFTMSDLVRAENQLSVAKETELSPTLTRCPLAARIVNTLANTR